MKTVYDIHMHLIPEVDDGAWNLDMALTMVQMAYCQGVRKIFATPTALHSEKVPRGWRSSTDGSWNMQADFILIWRSSWAAKCS